MRKFFCQCGQSVFFDSNQCVNCGALLGFDPETMTMLSLRETEHGLLVGDQQPQLDFGSRQYRFCSNHDHGVCNWLKPADSGCDSESGLCFGCQFNRTIPDLSRAENIRRWGQFEIARKRLFYTLLSLGLPLVNGFDDPENGLLLDFIEDQRSAPDHYPQTFVSTGFHSGVITINAMEADDALRESVRAAMNESYRTLLGHLRHESGHYYWMLLSPDQTTLAEFVELFGDPQQDYAQALERHYAEGTQPDWQQNYISAYASAHPMEDWAETWAHYLLIQDALETAYNNGLILRSPAFMSAQEKVETWGSLSISFNEMSRSAGLADAYPFVVSPLVTQKMVFVDKLIRQLVNH